MPNTFVKGDLFAASGLDALAHGCGAVRINEPCRLGQRIELR